MGLVCIKKRKKKNALSCLVPSQHLQRWAWSFNTYLVNRLSDQGVLKGARDENRRNPPTWMLLSCSLLTKSSYTVLRYTSERSSTNASLNIKNLQDVEMTPTDEHKWHLIWFPLSSGLKSVIRNNSEAETGTQVSQRQEMWDKGICVAFTKPTRNKETFFNCK